MFRMVESYHAGLISCAELGTNHAQHSHNGRFMSQSYMKIREAMSCTIQSTPAAKPPPVKALHAHIRQCRLAQNLSSSSSCAQHARHVSALV